MEGPSYNFKECNEMINACIKCVLDTESFSDQLLDHCNSDFFSFAFEPYISQLDFHSPSLHFPI